MRAIDRIAIHAINENLAFVGYPYPERRAEKQFVLENMPDRQGFANVLAKVQESWKGCTPKRLAELLLSAAWWTDGCGNDHLGNNQHDEQLREFGVAAYQNLPRAKTAEELEIYDGSWEYPVN